MMPSLPSMADESRSPHNRSKQSAKSNTKASSERQGRDQQIFYTGSSDEDSEEMRSRKRRKRDRFAADYLEHGYVPILTASLKGPFSAGWTNPWAKRRVKMPSVDETPAARRNQVFADRPAATPRMKLHSMQTSTKTALPAAGLASPFRMSSELGPPPCTPSRRVGNLLTTPSKAFGNVAKSTDALRPFTRSPLLGELDPSSRTDKQRVHDRAAVDSDRPSNSRRLYGSSHNLHERSNGRAAVRSRISPHAEARQSLHAIHVSPSVGKSLTRSKPIEGELVETHEVNGSRSLFHSVPKAASIMAWHDDVRHSTKRHDRTKGGQEKIGPQTQLTQRSKLLQACSEYLEENHLEGTQHAMFDDEDFDHDIEELEAGILPRWPDASGDGYEAKMRWVYLEPENRIGRQIFFNDLAILDADDRVGPFDDETLHDIVMLLHDATNRMQALLNRTSGDASTTTTIKRIDVLLQLNQNLEKVQKVVDLRERVQDGSGDWDLLVASCAKLLLMQKGAAYLTIPGTDKTLGYLMRDELGIEDDQAKPDILPPSETNSIIADAPQDNESNDGDVEMGDDIDTEDEDVQVVLENNAEHEVAEQIIRHGFSQDIAEDDPPIEATLHSIRPPSKYRASSGADPADKTLAPKVPNQSDLGIVKSQEKQRKQAKDMSSPLTIDKAKLSSDHHLEDQVDRALIDAEHTSEESQSSQEQPNSPMHTKAIDSVSSSPSVDSDSLAAEQQLHSQLSQSMDAPIASLEKQNMPDTDTPRRVPQEVICIDSDSEVEDDEKSRPQKTVKRESQDVDTASLPAQGKDSIGHRITETFAHTDGRSQRSSARQYLDGAKEPQTINSNHHHPNGHNPRGSGVGKSASQSKIMSQTETWSQGHPVRTILAMINVADENNADMAGADNNRPVEDNSLKLRQGTQLDVATGSAEELATEPPQLKWASTTEEDKESRRGGAVHSAAASFSKHSSNKFVSFRSFSKSPLDSGPVASQWKRNGKTDSPSQQIALISSSAPPPSMRPSTSARDASRHKSSPFANTASSQDAQRPHQPLITDEEERLALDDAQEFLSAWQSEKRSILGKG